MSNKGVAAIYATALYDAAAQANALSGVSADKAILWALGAERGLLEQFLSPSLGAHERERLIHECLSGNVHTLTVNFLVMLSRHNRLRQLTEIIKAFDSVCDERQGVVMARVVSAVALDEKMHNQLIAKLEKRTGKKIRAEFSLDPSLIGGLRVSCGDILIDTSISGGLDRLRLTLMQGTILGCVDKEQSKS